MQIGLHELQFALREATEDRALRGNVHDYLVVPEADRYVSPILATVPAQLMAYHMSVGRGIDPDFPRNLSKTLTVDWACQWAATGQVPSPLIQCAGDRCFWRFDGRGH